MCRSRHTFDAGEKQRPRPELLIRSFSSLTFYFLSFQNLVIYSSCFDQPCSLAKVNLASLFLSRFFPFVSLLWFICQVFPNMKSVFPIFRELRRFCERGCSATRPNQAPPLRSLQWIPDSASSPSRKVN